jgi:hypothetical protein
MFDYEKRTKFNPNTFNLPQKVADLPFMKNDILKRQFDHPYTPFILLNMGLGEKVTAGDRR